MSDTPANAEPFDTSELLRDVPLFRHLDARALAELEGGVRIVDGRRDRAPEQNFSVEASLRLIATLHDPAVIRKILAHLPLCHSGQSPDPAPPESGAAAS